MTATKSGEYKQLRQTHAGFLGLPRERKSCVGGILQNESAAANGRAAGVAGRDLVGQRARAALDQAVGAHNSTAAGKSVIEA